MRQHFKWQDTLVALSMANIMFLRVWRELLPVSDADAYWIPDHTAASYGAALFNVIWIAAALLAAAILVRMANRRGLTAAARVGFLLLFVFPLEYLRTALHVDNDTIHWCFDHAVLTGAVGLALAALGVYLVVWRLAQTARVFRFAALALVPLVLVTLPRAACQGVFTPREASGIAGDVRNETNVRRGLSGNPRIIWLLFDELDSRLAFLERPRDVALPNFDRLRAESVVALHGQSHGQHTSTAIPSFLTGRIVSAIQRGSKRELRLHFQGQPDGQFTPLDECPTIFSAVAARGGRSAVTGIYHPYPRLLGKDVDRCTAYMMNTYTPLATDSLLAEARSQLLGITPLYRRINWIRTYRGILQQCVETAGDPRYDVVYVHVSVPHRSNIYDRKSERFTLWNVARDGYLDNLALADRFLGEVRGRLEAKGMWDSSVVVVTSDHELRAVNFGDRRRVAKIPLLVKMPGQRESLVLEEAISPKLVVKDLLLAVLDGKVRTPEEVAGRLGRAGRYPESLPTREDRLARGREAGSERR